MLHGSVTWTEEADLSTDEWMISKLLIYIGDPSSWYSLVVFKYKNRFIIIFSLVAVQQESYVSACIIAQPCHTELLYGLFTGGFMLSVETIWLKQACNWRELLIILKLYVVSLTLHGWELLVYPLLFSQYGLREGYSMYK